MDERIEKLERRVDTHDRRLTHHDIRLAEHDKDLQGMRRVEQSVAGIRKELRSHMQREEAVLLRIMVWMLVTLGGAVLALIPFALKGFGME